MINIKATIRWKGYDPRDLKPKTRKRVWAICEDCGRGRWVRLCQYRNIGRCCSTKGKRNPIYRKYGEKHPSWKGGKKLSVAKYDVKRKKVFGFIPINLPQNNFDGHHLDFNYVIFIPKELHQSVWHSNTKYINMDIINNLAEEWYLRDQGVIL